MKFLHKTKSNFDFPMAGLHLLQKCREPLQERFQDDLPKARMDFLRELESRSSQVDPPRPGKARRPARELVGACMKLHGSEHESTERHVFYVGLGLAVLARLGTQGFRSRQVTGLVPPRTRTGGKIKKLLFDIFKSFQP